MIASKLRLRGAVQRDEAQAAVRRITGELAGIAEAAMREADAVVRNARRAVRTATGSRKGRLVRALNDLTTIVDQTRRVVAQTRSRLAGVMPIRPAGWSASMTSMLVRSAKVDSASGGVRLQSAGHRQC